MEDYWHKKAQKKMEKIVLFISEKNYPCYFKIYMNITSNSPLLFLTYILLDHLKIYSNYHIIFLCIIVYLKLKSLLLWQLQGEFKQKTKVYPTEDANYSSDQLYINLI